MHETDLIVKCGGERLILQDYRADFNARQWTIGGEDSWKLERKQDFREPGFPSWEAFAAGRWEEALQLITDERPFLEEFSARALAQGTTLYRVRVVEQPMTPYLQWELHLLRLRAACGERIRVVGPDALQEDRQRFPELVTLGNLASYVVLYDDHGVLCGAERFTDPVVVAAHTRLIRDLYAQGEDMEPYFARAVAPLPPPAP